MRPKVKYAVIYRHRANYPVSVMCKFFMVSRSGYYDFVKRLGKPEKDADLAEEIRTCQRITNKTYGYRRVRLWLAQKNIHRNPKTILRVMKKYGLQSDVRRRRKWVQMGQQLHSDQGFQYTSREYFNLTQSYGITPSMSRRGNCYDNAMAENFFSILKTECIYRLKPKTMDEARDVIDAYIQFYNHERIQLKTGVAPLTLRHSA